MSLAQRADTAFATRQIDAQQRKRLASPLRVQSRQELGRQHEPSSMESVPINSSFTHFQLAPSPQVQAIVQVVGCSHMQPFANPCQAHRRLISHSIGDPHFLLTSFLAPLQNDSLPLVLPSFHAASSRTLALPRNQPRFILR